MNNKIVSFNKLIVFVFITLLSVGSFAASDITKESFNVKSGGQLSIKSSSGSINIETWDKNEVFVEIKKEMQSEQRLKDLVITVTNKGNNVDIVCKDKLKSNESIRYSVSVPKKFNVKAETGGGSIKLGELITGNIEVRTSGGSIKVGDVDGDLAADTSGGSISVGKVTGITEVDTSGGSIKVEAGGKTVNADTSGGSIKIGPSEGDVNADTSGGSISIGHAKGNINADTSGGSIYVAGSDGNVVADTSGGNIKIENTAGGVKADTSGGGIQITGSRGSIIADTSGGDILAELVSVNSNAETPITLDSSNGTIKVYLPDNFKATVYAEINRGGRSNDTKIHSDFPLDITKQNNEVIAKGDINGGGNKVTLTTNNGEIYIKKLEK